MIHLLYFLLATVGLALIIVESELLSGFKEWFLKLKDKTPDENIKTIIDKIYYMLNCFQCSGFWAGGFVSLLMHPINIFWLFEFVIGGFVGSFISVIVAHLLNILEKKSLK